MSTVRPAARTVRWLALRCHGCGLDTQCAYIQGPPSAQGIPGVNICHICITAAVARFPYGTRTQRQWSRSLLALERALAAAKTLDEQDALRDAINLLRREAVSDVP